MGYIYQFIGHLLMPFAAYIEPNANAWRRKVLCALIVYFALAFLFTKYFFLFLLVLYPLLGLTSWAIGWFRQQRSSSAHFALQHLGVITALVLFHNLFYHHKYSSSLKQTRYAYTANLVDPIFYKWTGIHRGSAVLISSDYGLISGIVVGEPGDTVFAGPNWIETLAYHGDRTRYVENPPVHLQVSAEYSNPMDRANQTGERRFQKFYVGPNQYYLASGNPLDFKWGLYTIEQIQGRLVWGVSAGGIL